MPDQKCIISILNYKIRQKKVLFFLLFSRRGRLTPAVECVCVWVWYGAPNKVLSRLYTTYGKRSCFKMKKKIE